MVILKITSSQNACFLFLSYIPPSVSAFNSLLTPLTVASEQASDKDEVDQMGQGWLLRTVLNRNMYKLWIYHNPPSKNFKEL